MKLLMVRECWSNSNVIYTNMVVIVKVVIDLMIMGLNVDMRIIEKIKVRKINDTRLSR